MKDFVISNFKKKLKSHFVPFYDLSIKTVMKYSATIFFHIDNPRSFLKRVV